MLLRNHVRRIAFAFYRTDARRYLSSRLNKSSLSWLLPKLRRALLYLKSSGEARQNISATELKRLKNVESLEPLFPAARQTEVLLDSVAYPKISIVTPNYNQGRFLEECIRSVISQGYPNLEFFITDGASSDNSIDIIKKYADKLTWWVSERDNGQADAINKGLDRASGDIFNWLNADDRLAPGALFSCAEAYRANPEAVGWVGGCVRTNEDGAIADIIYPNGTERDHIGENWNGRQFYQPSCFLATGRLKRIGGLNPKLYIALDLDLWLRALLGGGRLVVGHGIWSIALNHEDAKTQKSIEVMVRETADLQEANGFVEGARVRRQRGRRGLQYVIPGSLRSQINESPETFGGWFESSIPIERGRSLCFVGDFGQEEDVEAVRFFVEKIFPIIQRKDWLEFHIIGRHAQRCGGLLKTPDLYCHDDDAAFFRLLDTFGLFVSPMIQRGGRAGKLFIAASGALPIVTTSAGCEGLPLEDGDDCFVADHPMEFAEKCLQVLRDPICWQRFSAQSRLLQMGIETKPNGSHSTRVAEPDRGF